VLFDLAGDVDLAIAWGIRARDQEPDNPDHSDWLAELYIEIGDFETSLALVPNPGIGLLFKMRRYEELIGKGEELVIDRPDDVMVRYLLAFAYNATGQYESAIWILRSTGLPQTIMEMPRMGADWDGFFTLINASLGAGDAEAAAGLSDWFINDDTHHQNPDWYVESMMACALSVLGRREEALKTFSLIRRSPRLPWPPVLRDSLCFQRIADTPEYLATLKYFEDRQAALREKLPATLAEFGVSL
jgi:tetratricopeptide (TPR) repeat protein